MEENIDNIDNENDKNSNNINNENKIIIKEEDINTEKKPKNKKSK